MIASTIAPRGACATWVPMTPAASEGEGAGPVEAGFLRALKQWPSHLTREMRGGGLGPSSSGTSVNFRDLRASESQPGRARVYFHALPRADAGALLASVELEAPSQEVVVGLLGLEGLGSARNVYFLAAAFFVEVASAPARTGVHARFARFKKR